MKRMTKHTDPRRAAMILGLLLSLAHAGLAQQTASPQAAKPAVKAPAALPKAAAEETEQAASPAKPGSEGLRMHGHWVIDVRNPDGTLAEHRDFQNSITGAGQAYLIQLMAGWIVPGDYAVGLLASPTICTGSGICAMVHSLTTSPGNVLCNPANAGYATCYTGLNYTYNTNTSGTASMVLSGSFTATQAGSIFAVFTYSGGCANNASVNTVATGSPATCDAASSPVASDYAQLTGTPVTATAPLVVNPIVVYNGQLVQVNVTFTFS